MANGCSQKWAWVLLAVFMCAVFVQGAQAADSYQMVKKWGTYGTGNGQFKYPQGVAIDSSGYVYVMDSLNNRMQKFDSNGNFVTKWDNLSLGTVGGYNSPQAIAIDSSGNLYLSDDYSRNIYKFSPQRTLITKWGSLGTGDGQFHYIPGIAVDPSGNVIVVNNDDNVRNAHNIQKFLSDGTFLKRWGTYGAANGQFMYPQDVAVDAAGNVYVADTYANRTQKFDPNGQFIKSWGSTGSGDGQFRLPYAIAVDSQGFVYVAEYGNDRIQKFTSDGVFVTKWGSTGTGDGQFLSPIKLAVDASGNVYVSDFNNARIQKFAPVSPQTYNFTGSWTMGGTNGVWGFGNCMALRQSGTQVSGNYTHELGMVTGTVSGNTFSGIWAEAPTYTGNMDSGKYVVTMSTDGQSFSGTFGYGSSSTGYSFTGTRSSTICPVPNPINLSVTGITPSTAPNSGPVGIIDLSGSGFPQTVSVKLTRWGSQAITASGITVASQSKITCNFDLTGKDTGTWDVVVTKPDGQSATLPNGFTITAQPGAVLTVSSYPTGADLFIDGVQRGTTPATFTDILPGTHSISITKPGYYGYYSQFSVNAGQPTPVDVTLQPLPPIGTGSISITSTPKDTAVYLDSIYKGLGLTVLSNISSGYHSLKLTKSNYNDFGDNVYVTAGATKSVVAVLTPVVTDASISASSTPTGAEVYLDGNYKGLTPTQISGVKPGNHIVSFKKVDYTQTSQSVTVAAGEKKTVAVNLIIIKKECLIDLGVVCLPGFESVIAVIALLSVVAVFRKRN